MSRSSTGDAAGPDDEPAVAGELADVGVVDAMAVRTAAMSSSTVVGRDGDDHPLLGLGQPDLPRLEAGVLQRHRVELDVGTQLLGHLADRRRQAARTAVGDRGPQVLGAVEHVDRAASR